MPGKRDGRSYADLVTTQNDCPENWARLKSLKILNQNEDILTPSNKKFDSSVSVPFSRDSTPAGHPVTWQLRQDVTTKVTPDWGSNIGKSPTNKIGACGQTTAQPSMLDASGEFYDVHRETQ